MQEEISHVGLKEQQQDTNEFIRTPLTATSNTLLGSLNPNR